MLGFGQLRADAVPMAGYAGSGQNGFTVGFGTAIPIDTRVPNLDPSNAVDTGNHWITIPTTGAYAVAGQVKFTAANSAQLSGAGILLNGSSVLDGEATYTSESSFFDWTRTVSGLVYCTAGDHLQLQGVTSVNQALKAVSQVDNYLMAWRVA